MNYPAITIEGSILSYDLLDRFSQDDTRGQKPGDFGLSRTKVKDEIGRTWAEARDLWYIFRRQKEKESVRDARGTTRTRNYWIIPFLGLLGYECELAQAELVNNKSFAISHQAINRDRFPIHVTGFCVPLDKKQENTRGAVSIHGLVQEYLNLSEECLYALITNGLSLRLLRDSSRLIRLSYIEFNLEQMMEEEHFADFAIMYRLLHATRMPASRLEPANCLIEQYHQDSLEDGARIREGLSKAVEKGIILFANGFLSHPDNNVLTDAIRSEELTAREFFHHLLFLVYRLLFLMVIEERGLVFMPDADKRKQEIYYNYYSIGRLRSLCEQKRTREEKCIDLWEGLKQTFRLFGENNEGLPLHITSLAGDLFASHAKGYLGSCTLNNTVLLAGIELLNWFEESRTRHIIRVNYASLNVEEFGSVYEGLLENDGIIEKKGNLYTFCFIKGSERSFSGSHYTPEELVKPLIHHSLDYIIEEKLTKNDKEMALLSITVCDPACGSGHVILNAARRIGRELARVRTGEEQPAPAAYRHAVRDVIRSCIYGVDKNPLAVELCKIALWLEAHEPGEPLNFLDHHIKCGDSILGLARKEELDKGIPTEAFKAMKGDDKSFLTGLRRQHIKEKKEYGTGQQYLKFEEYLTGEYTNIKANVLLVTNMPEDNAEKIEAKKNAYLNITNSAQWTRIKRLCDIICAQFFLPKTRDNKKALVTEATFHNLMTMQQALTGNQVSDAAGEVAQERGFFHWFLEFPEVMEAGGFDCVLGNPPFLGHKKISGFHGTSYLNWLLYAFAPAGAIDEVGYFFRRAFTLLKEKAFMGFIATNTIAQGGTREGALSVIKNNGGNICFAVRSTPWPGHAAVTVSLVAINKGEFLKQKILDGKKVDYISTYLDETADLGDPLPLLKNTTKSFIGSIVMGKGFIITPEKAKQFINHDINNQEIIFKYLIGEDLNSHPTQNASRFVINFFDWPISKAKKYIACFNRLSKTVKEYRLKLKKKPYREKWWQFAERCPGLYKAIHPLKKVLVAARVSKNFTINFINTGIVFSEATVIFVFENYNFFAILQSTIHNEWAWKNCSTMKGDLRYSPTMIFQTFPFPPGIFPDKKPGTPLTPIEEQLEILGREYHEFRSKLMLDMQLGLTKTYNQFHNPRLGLVKEGIGEKEIRKSYGKATWELWKHLEKTTGTCSFEKAVEGICKLRSMHRDMDLAVLKAYGWQDIDPAHDFYEVDYLPENDRVRYTISPEARKEVLKRLLLLNHKYHQEEVDAGLVDEKGKVLKKGKKVEVKEEGDGQLELF